VWGPGAEEFRPSQNILKIEMNGTRHPVIPAECGQGGPGHPLSAGRQAAHFLFAATMYFIAKSSLCWGGGRIFKGLSRDEARGYWSSRSASSFQSGPRAELWWMEAGPPG